MRFGRDLPWHQIPKWADSYVNYDEWKHLAKAAKSQELKAAIARDSLTVEKFLDNKDEAVAQLLSILNDEYGITVESWHQETVLHSIPGYEKLDIIATLTDICSLLTSLSSYISVTQQAVERIRSKTPGILYELETLGKVLRKANTKWVNDIRSINAVLQNLHPVESPEKDGTSLFKTPPLSWRNSFKMERLKGLPLVKRRFLFSQKQQFSAHHQNVFRFWCLGLARQATLFSTALITHFVFKYCMLHSRKSRAL
ncbi:hypothetical protein GGR58DRAFT_381066 [Xylaria digitata]|nr:hypothetical protein GGR58DRAFT_381066 [Xylaria digitata]